jgi:hypothetical protein
MAGSGKCEEAVILAEKRNLFTARALRRGFDEAFHGATCTGDRTNALLFHGARVVR